MNRVITYLRYFFYLASNWNLRLAGYIIWHEIKGEDRYHLNTSGADELQHLEDAGIDISHATVYMPVAYPVVEKIFACADAGSFRHFLDIGCGKGRALCMAAHWGVPKVTGIDFSRPLCESARANLAIVKQQFPKLEYQVVHNDAFYYDIPADVDGIFLFNPFDAVIMSGVVKNILKSAAVSKRRISVLYANPMHKEVFLEAGFREVYHFQRLKYLEAILLRLD